MNTSFNNYIVINVILSLIFEKKKRKIPKLYKIYKLIIQIKV